MSGGATDRLARLLALVPYLMARPGARVEDVAKAFGVEEDRLADDLELLFVCGLPGHLPDDLIEASIEGGVISISNADTIARPLRLGADEALALLVGLRTLRDIPEAIPGLSDPGALDRTIVKLERASGEAAQGSAALSVALDPEADVTGVVRRALEARKRLHLRYYVPARDETTERDVDPMRLLIVEGRPYLEAWCRKVEDVRLFRLDRVVALEMLDVAADVPAEAVARDVDDGLFRPSETDLLVTLELGPSARWVAEYYACESVQELPDGSTLVRLRTPDLRWVRRLALRLGPAGRVLEPLELVADVRTAALAALAHYDGP
jgi:proteasome accessory factor C